jgi:murein DD-endopeptidase MepM/ murein hydrolase activator NlpD
MRFRFLWAVLLAGCASSYALHHRLAPGENLASVAAKYGTTEERLREWNRLAPGASPRTGDWLFVPGAPGRATPSSPRPRASPTVPPAAPASDSAPPKRPAPESSAPAAVPKAPQPQTPIAPPPPPPPAPPSPALPTEKKAPLPKAPQKTAPRSDLGEAPAAPTSGALRWPVRGRILHPFGAGSGGENQGIDIGVPAGSPVLAAAAGKVSYSGSLPAYGSLVVLDHGSGLHTVYANLAQTVVRRGEKVAAGQKVGLSGPAAGAAAPHLHFEVRRRGEPFDPLLVLPPP